MTTTPNEQGFDGFYPPTENWSKFPHQIIAYLPQFDKKHIILLVYLLRHTWGYGDDDPKKITIDEFMHGRKRRDGSRIDGGTGLAKSSVINGLDELQRMGFIEVETDDRDKARIEKFYMLRMSKIYTSDVQNLDTGGIKIRQRSEKDTPDRNLQENTSIAATASDTSSPSKAKTPPTRLLTKIVKESFAPIIARFSLSLDWEKLTPAEQNAAWPRIGTILASLKELDGEQNITPAELEAAYAEYRRRYPDAAYPAGNGKIAGMLSTYRATQRGKARQASIPTRMPRQDCARCHGSGIYEKDGLDYQCNCSEEAR